MEGWSVEREEVMCGEGGGDMWWAGVWRVTCGEGGDNMW